ncbi:MAG: PilZ domain-containing protein [Candidatus Omnitrophota bacterium]|nr:PilZ domain-containing protein [Candidatus Omnitrophota bacterium]
MDERRKFIRLNANVVVQWKKVDKENAAIGDTAVSKNVSVGGISLILYDEKLEIGDIINLEIQLPQEENVFAKGKVVWINEFEIMGQVNKKRYDVGVEFVDIKELDSNRIKKYVFTFFHEGMF